MNRELIDKQVVTSGVRLEEVELRMADPSMVTDRKLMSELGREYRRLKNIVDTASLLTRLERQLADAYELAETDDKEMAQLAQSEAEELKTQVLRTETDLFLTLVPPEESDDKTAIVEIRAGTGGEEAALFAGDLYRMYQRFCERCNWRSETISVSPSGMGGFKEIVFSIKGDGTYGLLKYESGVHRVQRVPSTEAQGRIHTSAASVAILPEAEDVDVDIRDEDLRVDTFRASGAGGQHVNKTESAVRITHLPTGIVVSCQDEKSQHKNRAQAMRVLRSRLYEQAIAKENAKRAASRKLLVSTGDRSAKIRTYNFPQGRITDHRINLTLYRLHEVLDGDLEEMIEALRLHDAEDRLREGTEA
ncbi:MAG: peptide chain release factor 1 [bacterium]